MLPKVPQDVRTQLGLAPKLNAHPVLGILAFSMQEKQGSPQGVHTWQTESGLSSVPRKLSPPTGPVEMFPISDFALPSS